MRDWMRRTWTRYCEDGNGPIGWLLVAVLVVLIVVLGCALSGCALLGERPQVAVSLEADRQLAAAARRDVEVVLAGARAGHHQATARLLEGVVQGLGTLQAGPIGVAVVAPWPAEIVERVAAELRCEPVVRVEADPAVLAALDAERAARAGDEARSRAAHGEAQEWQRKAVAAAAEAAGKWGLGTVATGGGGLLVGLLGLAWRNRAKARAVYAMVRTLQEVKHGVEAGQEVDVAEVVTRHAGANGAKAEIDRAYEQATGKRAAGRKPDLRERSKAALKKLKAKFKRKKKPKT